MEAVGKKAIQNKETWLDQVKMMKRHSKELGDYRPFGKRGPRTPLNMLLDRCHHDVEATHVLGQLRGQKQTRAAS
jgi:hypothetical protein